MTLCVPRFKERPVIVCSCNVISEKQIIASVVNSVDAPRTAAQMYRCLGCSPQCGRCARTIRAMLNDLRKDCPARETQH